MSQSRRLVVVAVAGLFVISLVILASSGFLNMMIRSPSTGPSMTVTRSTCDRPPGFILIIADLSGFNNSIGHGAPAHPWPVIHVQEGQTVRLVVCNQDPTQPHGFAITYYLDAGVVMAPGDAYRIIFVATRAGTFDVFCNIFCTIHVFMRGQLVVS